MVSIPIQLFNRFRSHLPGAIIMVCSKFVKISLYALTLQKISARFNEQLYDICLFSPRTRKKFYDDYTIVQKMREIFVVIISILMVACSTKEQSNNQSANNQSDGFLPGVKLAELNNKELKEISGIAASVNNPKLLWAHN